MTVYKCCFFSHKSLLIAILRIRRLWIPVFLSFFSFFPLFFFFFTWGVIEWFGQEAPAHNESSHNRRDLCKLHLAWGSYKLASSILPVMSTEWSLPRSAEPGKCVPPRPGRFHYLASVHMARAERKRMRKRRWRRAPPWLGSDFGRGLFVNIRSGGKLGTGDSWSLLLRRSEIFMLCTEAQPLQMVSFNSDCVRDWGAYTADVSKLHAVPAMWWRDDFFPVVTWSTAAKIPSGQTSIFIFST